MKVMKKVNFLINQLRKKKNILKLETKNLKVKNL